MRLSRFVVEEDVPVIPRLAVSQRRRRHEVVTPEEAHARAAWRRPTADDLEFRLVRVTRGEQTCLECFETFNGTMCPRCGLPEPGQPNRYARVTPSIPTESYLQPEEYRSV